MMCFMHYEEDPFTASVAAGKNTAYKDDEENTSNISQIQFFGTIIFVDTLKRIRVVNLLFSL